MIKIVLLETLFLLQVSNLLCQTTIKGNIQTDKNQPVIGANIYFKGSIEGTNSDEQGKFLLSTNLIGDQILVVSYIGYKTHEEPVKLQNKVIDLFITISENVVNLKEELGDALWYIAIICKELDIHISDIMMTNIEKLKARYGEKFSEEKALNRDLEVELEILKK